MSSPFAVALLILVPVAAVTLVTLAQRLAPGWAEAHDRNRRVEDWLLPVERAAGCLFGLISAAMVVGGLLYIWLTTPHF